MFQFSPLAWICWRSRTSGLTLMTPGTSRAIASASSTVIVPAPPQPLRTPPLDQFPANTRTTFCPRLAICASTCDFAPLPIPTMAMTAPTPMMMPSAVSVERILLRRSARRAMRSVAAILMRKVSPPVAPAGGGAVPLRPPTGRSTGVSLTTRPSRMMTLRFV